MIEFICNWVWDLNIMIIFILSLGYVDVIIKLV